MTGARRRPGWERLWWHSYHLGWRWLVRDARSGWRAGRAGFVRLVVPLDPWRFYELGRVADERFSGRCLDVSSPKLLPSLLQREGSGEWTCIDLFEKEVDAWRRIDPDLTLAVEDATDLSFLDDTFDNIVCLSVLEHIGHSGDRAALSQMWRVLKPGGTLHLTTDVSPSGGDVFVGSRIYGEASQEADGAVFFKHDYAVEEIEHLVDDTGWEVRSREFAVQRDPSVEERFYGRRPWSYAYGPLLRFRCPANVEVSGSPTLLTDKSHGVIYLQLQKPDSS